MNYCVILKLAGKGVDSIELICYILIIEEHKRKRERKNRCQQLCAIRDNKGMAPAPLLDRLWKEYQGRWNNDTMNVVLVAMGKKVRYLDTVTTDAQFASLVEKAQRDNAGVLVEIKKLREQKGK